MENPQRPKHNRTLGLLAVLLTSACVVGGAMAYMSSQDKGQASSALSAPNTRPCAPSSDILKAAEASVRGSTQVVPWTVFNQQFGWSILGVSPVDAVGVPSGRALRFKIPRVGRMAHEIGVSMLNARPIKSGEVIQARVWLRSDDALKPIEPSLKSTTIRAPVLVEVRFQNNDPGFRGFFQVSVPVTNQFREYAFTATVPKDYCAEELNVALHLATGQHDIDIGPGSIIVTGAQGL